MSNEIIQVRVGLQRIATKSAEGIAAGDTVEVVEFSSNFIYTTGKPLDPFLGVAHGHVKLRNLRTKVVSDHGACVLGPNYLDTKPVPVPSASAPEHPVVPNPVTLAVGQVRRWVLHEGHAANGKVFVVTDAERGIGHYRPKTRTGAAETHTPPTWMQAHSVIVPPPARKIPVSKLRDRTLVVSVTEKDIAEATRRYRLLDNGENFLGECCPVALATTRALRARFRRYPGIRTTIVSGRGRGVVYVNDRPLGSVVPGAGVEKELVCRLSLPPALSAVVRAFDQGSPGRPTPATGVVQLEEVAG